jgi:UPF0271 protein
MGKGIILDSSAILRSNLDFTTGGFTITNGVLAEIADPNAREAINYGIRSSHIKILDPKQEYVEKVIEAAKKTGDIANLSEVDIGVIAVAVQHGLKVASDDYAVQNTCSALGLEFQTTVHEGIKRQVKWVYRCVGCGRTYEPGVRECGVCGSEVRKTMP